MEIKVKTKLRKTAEADAEVEAVFNFVKVNRTTNFFSNAVKYKTNFVFNTMIHIIRVIIIILRLRADYPNMFLMLFYF